MDVLEKVLATAISGCNVLNAKGMFDFLDKSELEIDKRELSKRVQTVCMDLMSQYAYHLLPFGDSLGKQYLIHRISENPKEIGLDDVMPVLNRYKNTADVAYPELLFHQILLLYQKQHPIDVNYLDCKETMIQFMNLENCWVGCYMKSHFPTHQFHITKSVDETLESYWNTGQVQYIPSDMLLSGCVPVLDSELVVHIPGVTKTDREHTATVRICVFQDYRKEVERAEMWLQEHANDEPQHEPIMTKDAHLRESDKKGLAIVGAMELRLPNKQSGIVCEFGVMPGVDGILLSNFLYHYGKESDFESCFDGLHDIRRVCCDFLKTWYNIQISMFHPFLRSMFEKMYQSSFRWKRAVGSKVSPQRIESLQICYLFEESLSECQNQMPAELCHGWGCIWQRKLEQGHVKIYLEDRMYPDVGLEVIQYHMKEVLLAYEQSCKSSYVCRGMGPQCNDCKVYKSVVK